MKIIVQTSTRDIIFPTWEEEKGGNGKYKWKKKRKNSFKFYPHPPAIISNVPLIFTDFDYI